MKRLSLLMSFYVLAVLLFCACSQKADRLQFKTVIEQQTFKIGIPKEFQMDTVPVYSVAKVELTIPKWINENEADRLQKALMEMAFPEDSVSKNWDDAVKRFLEAPVEYAPGQTAEKVDGAPDGARLLTKSVVVDTMGVSRGIYTFFAQQEGYSGGAHGYYMRMLINYDSKSDALLTSENLFADKPAIRNLILQQLVKDNKLHSVAELETNFIVFSVADVDVPDNFYFDKGRIVFFYNPYEIASWAQGEIEVAIPIASVMPYLTPFGKEILAD